MTSDPDIYRAAKLFIDRHGENALLRAVERADQLLDAGDSARAAPTGAGSSRRSRN